MRLTGQQRGFFRDNCQQWLSNPLAFSRSGSPSSRPNARLFAIHKVRWRDDIVPVSETVREAIALSLPHGGKNFAERTIVVDWGGNNTNNGEWIIPIGQNWSCYPLALLNLSGDRKFVEECVSTALEGIATDVEWLLKDKIDVGLVGVKKFITIKRRAFPTIGQLLGEINA
jgi:hypothetical protein